MIDEWCGSAPGRYIPLVIIPLWDPHEAALEVERCAERGARAFTFSENPAHLGLPTVHNPDRYWDPVFAAAEQCGTVVCMHSGSSSHLPRPSDESPLMVTTAWGTGAVTSGTLIDWLFSGVFERFPGLKVALSEGGIGWIPYFLERAEQVVEKQRFWAAKADFELDLVGGKVIEKAVRSGADFDNLDVRQLFQDHVYGCFIDDIHGVRNIDTIGIDNVMVETDYPHSDSTWPDCITLAKKRLAGLSETDMYKVLRGNAERLFRYAPVDPASIV
jgi:predicted TIM-barrel fold metal-dependent hydrolase